MGLLSRGGAGSSPAGRAISGQILRKASIRTTESGYTPSLSTRPVGTYQLKYFSQFLAHSERPGTARSHRHPFALLLPPLERGAVLPEFASRNTKSLLYQLMRRVPLRDSVEVHQAILQIQLIETEFLDKEPTSEQSSGYLEKVRKIRDIRWIPARYMERSSRLTGMTSRSRIYVS